MKKIALAIISLTILAIAANAEGVRVFVEGPDGTLNGIPAAFISRPQQRPETTGVVNPFFGRCWVRPATADENGISEGFCLDLEGVKTTNM